MTNLEIITNAAIAAELYTEDEAKTIISERGELPIHTYTQWRKMGYSSVFLLGSFFLKGSGFPATLKIPISPGSKFRRLALFPLPLSPRINTGIPISHSSLSNTTRSAAFKMNMLPSCVIESVLSLYTSTNWPYLYQKPFPQLQNKSFAAAGPIQRLFFYSYAKYRV